MEPLLIIPKYCVIKNKWDSSELGLSRDEFSSCGQQSLAPRGVGIYLATLFWVGSLKLLSLPSCGETVYWA